MDIENNFLAIYQAENGAIELRSDFSDGTIWASLDQIAQLFGRDKSVVSRHIKNIFKDGELVEEAVVAKNATTATDGKKYKVNYYNLDLILSVGYRVNSKIATNFRQWATKTLKSYIYQGYAINEKKLVENKERFLQTLDDLKALTQNNTQIGAKDVLTLIRDFSNTFFVLDSYDKNNFPTQGKQTEIATSARELFQDLLLLKNELVNKREATDLFAQEKVAGSIEGIFGNVFQSVFGLDAYPSVEEKAAHLLYFVVKNHPFSDGNKRSGAFCFIWLLQKANYPFKDRLSPEALTALTLLIAESGPEDKDKMIGIAILLLNSIRK